MAKIHDTLAPGNSIMGAKISRYIGLFIKVRNDNFVWRGGGAPLKCVVRIAPAEFALNAQNLDNAHGMYLSINQTNSKVSRVLSKTNIMSNKNI